MVYVPNCFSVDLKTGVSSVNGCGGACGCEGVGVHVGVRVWGCVVQCGSQNRGE